MTVYELQESIIFIFKYFTTFAFRCFLLFSDDLLQNNLFFLTLLHLQEPELIILGVQHSSRRAIIMLLKEDREASIIVLQQHSVLQNTNKRFGFAMGSTASRVWKHTVGFSGLLFYEMLLQKTLKCLIKAESCKTLEKS